MPAADAQPYCGWHPDFAALVYDASLGIVHLHEGAVCTAHLLRPPA